MTGHILHLYFDSLHLEPLYIQLRSYQQTFQNTAHSVSHQAMLFETHLIVNHDDILIY